VTVKLKESTIGRADVGRLRNIFLAHRGRHSVYVEVNIENQRVVLKLGKGFKITPEKGFVEAIEQLIGTDAVAIRAIPPPREQQAGPRARLSSGRTP